MKKTITACHSRRAGHSRRALYTPCGHTHGTTARQPQPGHPPWPWQAPLATGHPPTAPGRPPKKGFDMACRGPRGPVMPSEPECHMRPHAQRRTPAAGRPSCALIVLFACAGPLTRRRGPAPAAITIATPVINTIGLVTTTTGLAITNITLPHQKESRLQTLDLSLILLTYIVMLPLGDKFIQSSSMLAAISETNVPTGAIFSASFLIPVVRRLSPAFACLPRLMVSAMARRSQQPAATLPHVVT
jgi:hypothetical protein